MAAATREFDLADWAKEIKVFVDKNLGPSKKTAIIGLSIGGAAALEVATLVDHRTCVIALAIGTTIGTPQIWAERSQLALSHGTASMKEAASQRWFTEDFREHHRPTVKQALQNLADTDDTTYSLAADALGRFDFSRSARLATCPVLVISGELDAVSPVAEGELLAKSLPQGEFQQIDNVAHLIPLEAPKQTAELILNFLDEKFLAD